MKRKEVERILHIFQLSLKVLEKVELKCTSILNIVNQLYSLKRCDWSLFDLSNEVKNHLEIALEEKIADELFSVGEELLYLDAYVTELKGLLVVLTDDCNKILKESAVELSATPGPSNNVSVGERSVTVNKSKNTLPAKKFSLPEVNNEGMVSLETVDTSLQGSNFALGERSSGSFEATNSSEVPEDCDTKLTDQKTASGDSVDVPSKSTLEGNSVTLQEEFRDLGFTNTRQYKETEHVGKSTSTTPNSSIYGKKSRKGGRKKGSENLATENATKNASFVTSTPIREQSVSCVEKSFSKMNIDEDLMDSKYDGTSLSERELNSSKTSDLERVSDLSMSSSSVFNKKAGKNFGRKSDAGLDSSPNLSKRRSIGRKSAHTSLPEAETFKLNNSVLRFENLRSNISSLLDFGSFLNTTIWTIKLDDLQTFDQLTKVKRETERVKRNTEKAYQFWLNELNNY